jgi:hypothetical protein
LALDPYLLKELGSFENKNNDVTYSAKNWGIF